MTQLYGHLILFYFTFLISHTKFHYSALRSLPWSFILLMFIVRYTENLKCPFWFTYYEIANFCQFLRLQQPYIHTLYFFYGYIGPISILKRISLQKKTQWWWIIWADDQSHQYLTMNFYIEQDFDVKKPQLSLKQKQKQSLLSLGILMNSISGIEF